ncbi:MAG TPA: hypothetical protein VKB57_28630 [Acidimicrobiales bacterium]|nr:hypothetical protein [Acidimicrobiales bacterium]
MRYVALAGSVLALALGLTTGHGAPRCGGEIMRPGEWCAAPLVGRPAVSYDDKAALLDDVSRTALALAGALGVAGTASVIAARRRERDRAALATRAEGGPVGALLALAERRDLGAVVASGVARDRRVVHLCERGVAVDCGGQPVVVAWDDLVATYEALEAAPTDHAGGDADGSVGDRAGGDGTVAAPAPVALCRLVTADAALDLRAAPGDPVVPAVAEAAAAALGRAALPALVEAVGEGHWVEFGPLKLDASALYRDGRRPTSVPWSRVEAVVPRVRVSRAGVTSRLAVVYRDARRAGRRRRFSVDLAAVPNPRLLMDLAGLLGPRPQRAG